MSHSKPQKILAFAGSNSQASINKQLVTHAVNVYQQEFNSSATVKFLDLNDFEMPIYSIDRETESGIPDLAKSFYKEIGEADALFISYAEHNGGYSVAYKNIFDWCSRIDKAVYQNKPMIALSTSPGPGGAARILKQAIDSAPHFGAEVKGSLSVSSFNNNFDREAGVLSDEELSLELRQALSAL